MIETRGLTKRYGDHVALSGLDLSVEAGRWFLYLGPNGAGKTTTLQMLVGLLEPTAGEARVAGLDPRTDGPALRRRVGYLPDDFEPHRHLTGEESLRFVGDMHGLPPRQRDDRIDELLDLLDLGGERRVPTREYSHGMRKKLGLASALVHDPDVLVLDEPTAELDPRTSDLIRRVLRGLADRGATILMSTHILGVAEHHADAVGVLDRGRLVRSGPVRSVLAEFPGATLEEVFLSLTGAVDEEKVARWLERRPNGSR